MYKVFKIKDRIRVPPDLFSSELKQAITQSVKDTYINQLSSTYGLFIALVDVNEIGEGRITPGDGAIYYETTFDILSYKPELHEIGPSLALLLEARPLGRPCRSLQGKESKRNLKARDRIRSRVVAVSIKSLQTAKIGLTMRQMGLGKLEWIEEDKKKDEKPKKVKADAK
jgi:DNA-directed RNA polymerase subunit E'